MYFLEWLTACLLLDGYLTKQLVTNVGSQVEIVTNKDIHVNYGRSVALSNDLLYIKYKNTSFCEVTVFNHDPSSLSIGTVLPSMFPCDFDDNQVFYQHYGSMSRMSDIVKMQARVDTESNTVVKSFILKVNVLFDMPLEIVKKVENLIVEELGGLSVPISSEVLHVNVNQAKHDCNIRYALKKEGPPYFGSIVNTSDTKNGMDPIVRSKHVTCNDFLSGKLRYAHRTQVQSSNRDYVPLVIEVCDKTLNFVSKREFFEIPVRIRHAPENQPPIINYNEARYSLQVNQLIFTAVTSDVMKAEDRETDHGQLIFNVTTEYEPGGGYLVHTEDPSKPVNTFLQKDVKNLKIAYLPPTTLSTTQKIQQIWFVVIDNQGANSAPFYVIFLIKPMSTYAPQVTKNSGLTMFEGQSRAITRDVLEIRDPDNEGEVIISVVDGLFNGQLKKNGNKTSSFKIQDIEEGQLRYTHDGSETFSDSIVLRITDGRFNVDVLVLVTIISKDDSPPDLVYNTGTRLREGASKQIDQFDLSANDVDSDDSEIVFQIVSPPKAGYIFYQRGDQVGETENSIDSEAVQTKEQVLTFSQVSLVQGRIFYRHYGDEVFLDEFTFRVVDHATPPNESDLTRFIIDIIPVDDQHPFLHPSSTLTLSALESQTSILFPTHLRYTDHDSNDPMLRYTIIRPPYFEASGHDAGKIVFSQNQTQAISEFFQQDINNLNLIYKPLLREFGSYQQKVLVEFNVTDPAGNSQRDQTLVINLTPVNSQRPTVAVSVISIKQQTKKLITLHALSAKDDDNPSTQLEFLLKEKPRSGELLKEEAIMDSGSAFNLWDLENEKIEYIHDGSDLNKDEIKLLLTDGLFTVPVQLQIVILPTRNSTFASKVLNLTVTSQEGGRVALKFDTCVGNQTEFIINKKPDHGTIVKQGFEVDRFLFEEIEAGVIVYQHNEEEVGINKKIDNASIKVSNSLIVEGVLYTSIFLQFVIHPLNNKRPSVTGLLSFHINEAAERTITVQELQVVDIDTLEINVKCIITKSPKFGVISLKTIEEGSEIVRHQTQVFSFTAHDVRNGKVSYSQNNHKTIEPTNDEIGLKCTDGINTSPEVILDVFINPMNDEIPMLFIQKKLFCIEGDVIFFNLENFNPYDYDVPEDQLTITITRSPNHGQLIIHKNAELKHNKTFTKTDLLSQLDTSVMYQHDGSETVHDLFEIQLSDGMHSITKEIIIEINPMDDETPRLIANTGLFIDRGGTKVITQNNLCATDMDSEENDFVFIIMIEPLLGKLQMVINPSKTVDLRQGDNFTQQHINSRILRYTHLNGESGNRDTIRLDVTDGFNRLINQLFNIMITPEDIIAPTVVSNGLRLHENNKAILTTDILSATDLNSPDEKLQFTITKTPLKGHIESLDYPTIPITRFSQLDLASNKIVYIHTSLDEVKLDNFEFEVTDGRNKVFRMFRLHLVNINDKKPVLFLRTIQATYEKNSLITPFEMKITDEDTQPSSLYYIVVQPPKHGVLLFEEQTIVSKFTQKQISENRITYAERSHGIIKDDFTVTISDGFHKDFFVYPNLNKTTNQPVVVHVAINSLDKQVPVMKANVRVSFLEVHQSQVFFKFTVAYLEASTASSKQDQIRYTIREPTKHGTLMHTKNKNFSVSQFTQEEINKKEIVYILEQDSIASHDSFIFDVNDDKMNMLQLQTFSLNWCWIEIEQHNYISIETDGHIILTINRRGDLTETSFATLQLLSNSAILYKDFKFSNGNQVQFNPGEKTTSIKVDIVNNQIFEKLKEFHVKLTYSFYALIGARNNATVEILDPEDETTIRFSDSSLKVNEAAGVIYIPVKRVGDLTGVTRVICQTTDGSALGTESSKVTSYRDFISRESKDRKSVIQFNEGESNRSCAVTIIDDSLYENTEQFEMKLVPVYGGKVDEKHSSTLVEILEDERDESEFSLSESVYKVNEDGEYVTVTILRKGTDISVASRVFFLTTQTIPISAVAFTDYTPLVKWLNFEAFQSTKDVHVEIIDDKHQPIVEGEKRFSVLLKSPENGILGSPYSAEVLIDDRLSDRTHVHFQSTNHSILENDDFVHLTLIRNGDLTNESKVICYTRQHTAKVNTDFKERRKASVSEIVFKKGESNKICSVAIQDDNIYEADESFYVVIHSEESIVGLPHKATVVINDNDRTIIEFDRRRHFFEEPLRGQQSVEVTVHRTGDVTKTDFITVYTKDGSAKSGIHYQPLAKVLKFVPFELSKVININLLHDPSVTLRSAFSLNLHSESNVLLGRKRTIIFIEEPAHAPSVTFPLEPMVVSLMDYDKVQSPTIMPLQGYPLACITACNPRFPKSKMFNPSCQNIDSNRTRYRWQISFGYQSFNDITESLYFTRVNGITLDSVYFTAGSRVRCIARAFGANGEAGVESSSEPVTINLQDGLCTKRSNGEKPFSAQVMHIGANSPNKNLVKLRVLVPHSDGLIPLISTNKLFNIEAVLTPGMSRLVWHKCSNLITPGESSTSYSQDILDKRPSQPYELDESLRGQNTVWYYKHLDLESCLWTFENYYDMSELLNKCGGKIITNGEVKNSMQSQLVVEVPLYVAYVYRSPMNRGWTHISFESSFRLNALYNTDVISQEGVNLPGREKLRGSLYPTRIIVRKQDRKLQVDFRTKSKFRGLFLIGSNDGQFHSEVVAPGHPFLKFSLELIRNDRTFFEADQMWRFTSRHAMRDYSGLFVFKMVACVAFKARSFTWPPVCQTHEIVSFKLNLTIQQMSEPVETSFTLNTRFMVFNMPNGELVQKDVSFAEGEMIYGRVVIDESLGSSYQVNIKRVFLCAGVEGYVPLFQPSIEQYGCIANSPFLSHRFKILDRFYPDSSQIQFEGVKFNASLDTDDVAMLYSQPNADGFSLESTALFKASAASTWFLHVTYSVRALHKKGREISKRSAEENLDRDEVNVLAIGKDVGTNLQMIALRYRGNSGSKVKVIKDVSHSADYTLVWVVSIFSLVTLTSIVIIFVMCCKKMGVQRTNV